MTDSSQISSIRHQSVTRERGSSTARRKRPHRRLIIAAWTSALAFLLLLAGIWLSLRAAAISSELEAVSQLVPQLKDSVTADKRQEAANTVQRLQHHTANARDAAEDPLWTLAAAIPVIGTNFSAVTEVARSADDVFTLGVAPLIGVFETLSWDSLVPSSSGIDLAPLQKAAPTVDSAAHAVRASADRLERIDDSALLPQIAEPLARAREQLKSVTGALDASADASQIAPGMLGANGPRHYLLIIQNNAEVRASGGISGALAVLTLDQGKLSLGEQSSAGDIGVMTPVVPVDPEQRQIYTERVGKYMQDVNLTPDFPTAAHTAQTMWERKTGQPVSGVISIDPVALSYVLDATGPVTITNPELVAVAKPGLPTELSGLNVVRTLLSDVYENIEQPALQDAYFAGVAQEIFVALSDGKGNAKGMIDSLRRGASEGRVLVWSGLSAEQSVINQYAISGAIAGPSVPPAQFGVYFNDGTGAKMDYYVKRTVQLVKECPRDGYEETTVRITSTNTAPADAATSLPTYVTGGGNFGVPPGTVQTNIAAYGPVQANVETAKLDDKKTDFAPYKHSNRPVGLLAVRLAPGESRTLEFTFGKIVQHAEPNVVVTPTVRAVNEVILPTQTSSCS